MLLRTTLYLLSLLITITSIAIAEEAETSLVGKKKFSQYCGSCHSMEPPPTLAPPARGIVMHYSDSVDNREEFAEAVAEWVRAPSENKSKFPPGAIRRFGLMPPLTLPQEDVKQIAGWMWDEAKTCN